MRAALRALGRGEGGSLLLTGAPWIGRTRLAMEAASAARQQGVRGLVVEAASLADLEALDALELDPAVARAHQVRAVVASFAEAAASRPLLVLEPLRRADVARSTTPSRTG